MLLQTEGTTSKWEISRSCTAVSRVLKVLCWMLVGGGALERFFNPFGWMPYGTILYSRIGPFQNSSGHVVALLCFI